MPPKKKKNSIITTNATVYYCLYFYAIAVTVITRTSCKNTSYQLLSF